MFCTTKPSCQRGLSRRPLLDTPLVWRMSGIEPSCAIRTFGRSTTTWGSLRATPKTPMAISLRPGRIQLSPGPHRAGERPSSPPCIPHRSWGFRAPWTPRPGPGDFPLRLDRTMQHRLAGVSPFKGAVVLPRRPHDNFIETTSSRPITRGLDARNLHDVVILFRFVSSCFLHEISVFKIAQRAADPIHCERDIFIACLKSKAKPDRCIRVRSR